MKALSGGLEDAELHRAHRLARDGGQVEQTTERVRFRYVEVVAGQYAEMSTAPHDVFEMLVNRCQASLEHEGDRDVDPHGRGQMGAEVREQRIVSAVHQRLPVRGAHDGGPG